MSGVTRLRRPALGVIAGVAVSLWIPPALADTLNGSLILAYMNNPTLNAQRAAARATDEGVPQALSGYRPRVSFNGSVGAQYIDFYDARLDLCADLYAAVGQHDAEQLSG